MNARTPQHKTACVFCGATDRKLTSEHLLPEPVREIYAGFPLSRFYRQSMDRALETWEGPPNETKFRVVCKECNETWMSVIEAAAAPLLVDMIRQGSSLRLDAYQQRTLATWGFLKAVILQYTGKERLIPETHVKELFRRRQPPMRSQIWIAQYRLYSSRSTFRVSSGEIHYIVTWSVGMLAFHIWGNVGPPSVRMRFDEEANHWLKPIWPSSGLVTWPPQRYFNDLGILKLHRSFRFDTTQEQQDQVNRVDQGYFRSIADLRR